MKRRTILGMSMLGAVDLSFADTKKMPVIFVGHGSPMNAIRENIFTQTLKKWGQDLGKPKAIVVISAHWLTQGTTAIDNNLNPRTIYDFGGFPQELYNIVYPAKGLPSLAQNINKKIVSQLTPEWGLDHGAWTVLKHMFPQADTPVFQISIDYAKSSQFHYQLGKELSYLRSQGVLILGSGNIVHNLSMTDRNTPINQVSRAWAKDLDNAIYQALLENDTQLLINYRLLKGANYGIATPDHYYPFLYTLGAAHQSSSMKQVYEGFENGTLAMRCIQWN